MFLCCSAANHCDGDKSALAEDTEAPSRMVWTEEKGAKLQEVVDRVFGVAGDELKGMEFSLTIADPMITECPLIGCSTGFTTLCGYTMNEIVGRNCRFLVDPVPKELINSRVRTLARDFCEAVRERRDFRMREGDVQSWMPKMSSASGIFCAQTNTRKDGSLFDNLFYLKSLTLNDEPYIVGLQTELPRGILQGKDVDSENRMSVCENACRLLDSNWAQVERVLASLFWYSGPMRRQDDEDLDDGFVADPLKKF